MGSQYVQSEDFQPLGYCAGPITLIFKTNKPFEKLMSFHVRQSTAGRHGDRIWLSVQEEGYKKKLSFQFI